MDIGHLSFMHIFLFSAYKRLTFFADIVKQRFLFIFLIIFTVMPLHAQDESLFKRGEDLFMQNNLEQALPLLESSLEQEKANPRIYLYLGAIYHKLGLYKKAVDIYKKGIDNTDGYDAVFFFNLGNVYVSMGTPDTAELMYSEAVGLKTTYSNPYLNRANMRVKLGKYQDAIDDYTMYLRLEPDTSQRANIEKMISLLSQKIIEEQRQKEEEERRRKEEEARQKALLDSVLKSLDSAAEETQDIDAGTEGVQDYSEELELAD
ncbi:tetratricopeptide repeat protein [Spirochaetia bacterium 38H-sp]|uniref:Tetratricopeptide repeat protein n=1 Tax=Rarispira pelagica TaxID=3141764 RepID=A0ABU9UBY0_9SPIR